MERSLSLSLPLFLSLKRLVSGKELWRAVETITQLETGDLVAHFCAQRKKSAMSAQSEQPERPAENGKSVIATATDKATAIATALILNIDN